MPKWLDNFVTGWIAMMLIFIALNIIGLIVSYPWLLLIVCFVIIVYVLGWSINKYLINDPKK
jgi:hypothetical protein